MSNEQVARAAIQQQALRLKDEFADLEKMRSLIKPSYDQFSGRASMHLSTPAGVFVLWWVEGEQLWYVQLPNGDIKYALPRQLQESLQRFVQQLREEAVLDAMTDQARRLRDEYGDLDEIIDWAKPIYDYDDQRAELRFDTPVGVCRVWWGNNQWVIRIPDGAITHAPRGELRGFLSQVRQYLRKGFI